MLNITLSGSLPQLKPMTDVMQSMALRLGSDIRADIEAGGNPAWPDRVHPPGKANLSYILATLQLSSTANTATASFGGGAAAKYAFVHEMGWMIRRTPQMKKFFWAKFYETSDEFWKWMAISKNEFITIPQRAVVPGIYSRKDDYAKFIGQQLTITHSVPIAQG